MPDRITALAEVERYWLETGLSAETVADMRNELEQHLEAAELDGKTVDDVVGDRAAFAELWAAARKGRPVESWADVQSGKVNRRRRTRTDLILTGTAAAVLITVASQGGSEVDVDMWRWLWTLFAIALGIGEIFTAGFFLLPFAIGGAAAAILAWLSAPVLAQWLVFFGVSLFSLAFLRRFIERQDEAEQPRVGANRWVGSEGIVLQGIDPHTGSGMVRVLNEEWRATAFGKIPAGARIVVTDVDGARLRVEQLEG
jgi:membrane protein implicated in regulation of membrane protease activity/DNA-binding ferritin-like protein (Dps family)